MKHQQLDIQEASKLFQRTDKPRKKYDRHITLGLKKEEIERLAEITEELGVSRHLLCLYAVRDFMRRYEAGERPRVKSVLKLDM
jgi:hypothetical protein